MRKFWEFNVLTVIGFILSLALLLDDNIKIFHVPKEVKNYYNEYVSYIPHDCRRKVFRFNKFNIKFSPLGGDFIGFCNKMFRERKIILDTQYWKWMSEADKKQLLFHELSHCLINKNHVEDMTNYMYPTAYTVPEEIFVAQVKEDIKNYCDEF